MRRQDIDSQAAALGQKITEGLGTKGPSLEAVASRAGRDLPKGVRKDIGVILDARALQKHPKLARQIDQSKVDAAIRKTSDWLDTLDRPARRRAAALDLLADIGFKIVVVTGLLLIVLVWRGFL